MGPRGSPDMPWPILQPSLLSSKSDCGEKAGRLTVYGARAGRLAVK